MHTDPEPNGSGQSARWRIRRHAFLLFAWINVGLGLLGAVLPLMPTTVFFLIALWAFAQSSPRFHNWLYHHPRFGPALQAWHRERAIPLPAKLLAVTMMTASIAWLMAFSDVKPPAILALVLGLGLLATWIVTRPTATRAGKAD